MCVRDKFTPSRNYHSLSVLTQTCPRTRVRKLAILQTGKIRQRTGNRVMQGPIQVQRSNFRTHFAPKSQLTVFNVSPPPISLLFSRHMSLVVRE